MFSEPDYRPLFKEFEETGNNEEVFEKLISDVFKNHAITQSTLMRFGPDRIVGAVQKEFSQEPPPDLTYAANQLVENGTIRITGSGHGQVWGCVSC